MGSTAIAGEQVWPSQNDLYGSGVGGAAGDGNKFLEVQLRKLFPALMNGSNFVMTGGTVPASDADLSIVVAAGTAVLDGQFCQWPATSITVPDTATSYLFLKLVFGGGLITGLEIEDNTTNVAPASSVPLCSCVAAGGVITSTADRRAMGPAFTPLLPLSIPTGSTRTHEGSAVINADQNLSGVHFYTDFTLNAGKTLTVPAASGKRVVIIASGTITINGTIAAGSGGAAGVIGATGAPGTDQPGGNSFDSVTSAGAYLHGIQLAAAGVQLTGSSLMGIALMPWSALGGAAGGGSSDSAGGHGGGSIVLIAPTIILAATAVLSTSGGAGGSGNVNGGGGGGAGNVYIMARSYTDSGATFTQNAGAAGTGSAGNGTAGQAGVKQILLF